MTSDYHCNAQGNRVMENRYIDIEKEKAIMKSEYRDHNVDYVIAR